MCDQRRTGHEQRRFTASPLAVSVVTSSNILLRFGAGSATDAHVASQTIPVLASSLLTATLPQALVPVLVGERDAHAAGWAITCTFALIALPIVALAAIGAPLWVGVLFAAFDATTLDTTVLLTRIQLVSVVVAAALAAPLARLYAERRVLAAEGAFLAASVATVGLLPWMTSRYGIQGASMALVGRTLMQLLLVLAILGRPIFTLGSAAFRSTVWTTIRPMLAGAPIYKLGPVVDRLVGAYGGTGGMTLLIYGQHAWTFGLTLLDRVVAKPLLAIGSTLAVEGRRDAVRASYLVAMKRSLWFASLAVVLFALFGDWVLQAVSRATSLTSADASELYVVCLVLAGVAIAGAPGQASLATVYALRNTGLVTRIALASFVLATCLKIALQPSLGVLGIAVGAVCYQVVNFVALHRHIMKVTR